MSHVTFDNIYLGESGELGKLRFNPVGFGWKSYKNEENAPTTFSGSDVRSASWLRVARMFQLRLHMRSPDRPRVTFEGFKREDHDKVKRTLEDYFSIKLDTKDVSLKGWNWGKAVVQNNDIVFEVQHKTAFELPLAQVANSNIAGKNEVAIEFNPAQIEGASSREPDELVEIRLYVPGKSYKSKGSDAGSDAEDESDRDEDGNEVSAAEALHNTIKDKADIGAVVGDSIVVFDDVLVLTPRGRYSLEFFHDSVRLLGKSTDYRVPFTSIHRIFLLPKLDDLHRQIILGLDPPIRQGATRYPFLVAQWPKDEEVDAELNITDEELAKYPELQRKYEAPTASVVSRVLKSLTGKKITTQGSFSSAQGVSGIKANVKAVQGELYFLERSLIFIAKQPILIDLNKTESISFSRVGGGMSARTFDMRVASKSEAPDYVFSSISKEEVEPISTYLQSKGVRLKNEMDDAMDVDDVELGSDDDDVDDASIPSDDDKKGKKKEAKKPAAKRADDEEDESDDEDFASESSDGGSPSESDSESDAASDASDPMMEDIRRRQAAKAGKNKKGDASSGDEGKPKKKKAKKDEEDDE